MTSSRWWDAYTGELAERLLSEKSGRCGIAGKIKDVALYLWLIVGDIRQAIQPLQQYLGFTAGRWLHGQFEHGDSLVKFKEAGRNGQRDWCMSRVTRVISALSIIASSSACHGLLIITVITPLPTKPSATMQRTEAGEHPTNYWHADASAWCLLRSMQNTRRS